jgi:NADPH-dependent 2,4-dienoyl-CoA reductase/sulfur reductase-like enzyme
MILLDTGVVPDVALAQKAGLAIGRSGAIEVNPRMETSQDGIYAAGNCAEAKHRITGKALASALGTHAVQQGRVAGENMAGMRTEYPGVLQTSITRFFSLSVARTGLSEGEARGMGFNCESASVGTASRAGYFPPREKVTVKIVFDRETEKILGAQIAGSPWTCKRIDVAVGAISSGLTLTQLAQLDLAYSPPHAPLWDPLQIAANVGLRKLR